MVERAGGPTALRILLGTQLRRLREGRGVSARAAARAISGSESKISRIELGRTSVREVDIADLLDLYGVTDGAQREELLALACQANQPGWWHQYQDVLPSWVQAYVGLEESAESIRSYDTQFVPGLLRTEDYAAAVIALGDFSLDESERMVLLLKERQRKLASGRLRVWAIVDETVLRRPVGSAEIMCAQLEHLLQLCDQPGFTLQVVPCSGRAYVVPGSFTILSFARPELPDVVYLEQLTSALYLDKPADVDRYGSAMNRLGAASAVPGETRDIIRALLEQSGEPGRG
jgi:transcriptional regulator with XRE-family HTH domain